MTSGSWGGESGGLLSLKIPEQALRLPLEDDKGVPEKQGAGLSVFELQLCQLDEVLAEGGDAAGLEVHELWRGEEEGPWQGRQPTGRGSRAVGLTLLG